MRSIEFWVFSLELSPLTLRMRQESPQGEESDRDRDAGKRVKKFRSRSDFQLAALWTLLGTGAIVYWNGFQLQWWQCFVAVGVLSGLIHRSIWVGIFSFLGVALLCSLVVWILLLSTT